MYSVHKVTYFNACREYCEQMGQIGARFILKYFFRVILMILIPMFRA